MTPDKEDIFDPAYATDATANVVQRPKSQLKSFIDQPIKEEDELRYGSSKPRRVVIRAKVTSD